jgi:hypothetical protein
LFLRLSSQHNVLHPVFVVLLGKSPEKYAAALLAQQRGADLNAGDQQNILAVVNLAAPRGRVRRFFEVPPQLQQGFLRLAQAGGRRGSSRLSGQHCADPFRGSLRPAHPGRRLLSMASSLARFTPHARSAASPEKPHS